MGVCAGYLLFVVMICLLLYCFSSAANITEILPIVMSCFLFFVCFLNGAKLTRLHSPFLVDFDFFCNTSSKVHRG